MKKIFYLIVLLLSVNANAISNNHPPGYPDDADWKEVEVDNFQQYELQKSFLKYGIYTTLSKAFARLEEMAWARGSYSGRHPTNMKCFNTITKEATIPAEYSVISVDCTVEADSVVDVYGNVLARSTYPLLMDMHLYNRGVVDLPSCELEAFPLYTDGHDSNSDGEIDRCYNPADKIKVAETADEFCTSEPNASTLDDAQDSKIKSAARLAKQNLERMEADLATPNEGNKDRLNQIASLFGMANYQDPQFTILSAAINSSSLGCIKNRLAAAELDPSGNGYLSFEESTKGGSGVYCKSENGDDIIQLNVKDLNLYHSIHKNDELQELIVHEVKHACNDIHPDKMHYMDPVEIRKEFDDDVAEYKRLIGTGNELDILERLINNPYYFEYLLRAYL